ncbi:MAG: hypothetical protein ACI9TV_000087 [Sulfurimonas sp.]|jgi:hypothetical protein|uniref:hypothetical protein n=1 Tax=Sulfurimonas sp. TaxID=2022749 RepID=UPI0039E2F51E
MKKIFILISTIYIFLNVAYAQAINECKTDIYFGNGVWNSPESADDSIKAMNKEIINPFIIKNNPNLKAKYGEVKLQYNWGQGTMLDVLETYYQLKAAGQVNNYQFFTVMAILTGGSSILTISAVSSQALMEPLTRGWEQGNVNEMWQKYYNESFKLSHKVLLISHSQGGLFANRVHDIIAPTQYQNYFANLQVASPASVVKATKGDYVTLSTDLVSVDPIVNFIPGSMSPNASGDSGHEFISAYLSQADPLAKIITKTKQLLTNLDSESSQWETESEQNKNTKQYRITVKHRFDTSIGNIANVYPFAPSKELYSVNGEYVKASCGGTKILDADIDTWNNKKDNEFYYLEGTGEMISMQQLYKIIFSLTAGNGIISDNPDINIYKNINNKFSFVDSISLNNLDSNIYQLYTQGFENCSMYAEYPVSVPDPILNLNEEYLKMLKYEFIFDSSQVISVIESVNDSGVYKKSYETWFDSVTPYQCAHFDGVGYDEALGNEADNIGYVFLGQIDIGLRSGFNFNQDLFLDKLSLYLQSSLLLPNLKLSL